jgi:hypothetical protein
MLMEPSMSMSYVRTVVASLMTRHGWGAVSEDALVASVMNTIWTKGEPKNLEYLVRQQYATALYEAVRSSDQDLRNRGYDDLFRYLYRAIYRRWPDIAY